MADRQLDDLERTIRALADRTRLRILALLASGEICVCYIHASLRIAQPKASRHLACLRRAGLVVGRKDGLWVHYRLARPSNGVVAALLASVGHVLTHAAVTAADRQRCEKATGRRRSVPETALPVYSCCDQADAADRVDRTRRRPSGRAKPIGSLVGLTGRDRNWR